MTTRRIPVRRSRAADAARVTGGLALPVLLIGALGARSGIVSMDAILPVLFAGFLLGAIGLAFGIYALTDIWNTGVDGARAAISGIVYASPAIILLGLIALAAVAYPRLTDISTDTERAPVFQSPEAPQGRPGEREVALQRAAYPEVGTETYAIPIGEVYAAAVQVVENRGWTITRNLEPIIPPPPPTPPASPASVGAAALPQADAPPQAPPPPEPAPPSIPLPGMVASPFPTRNFAVIEAVARTPIFGFRDDVIVRLMQTPDGTRVDMRSASRTGQHDLGQNARRIKYFQKSLRAVLEPEPEGEDLF